jgi:glycerol kinase
MPAVRAAYHGHDLTPTQARNQLGQVCDYRGPSLNFSRLAHAKPAAFNEEEAMAELVVAIDQGTTGTTVMVIDPDGSIRGRAYGEIRQFFPHPGWVEHDPDEIASSAIVLTRQALRAARVKATDVAAIGITNQRETFVVWERATGTPVGRAIVWQCRRSADICNRLRRHESDIARRTGLVLDPYFSASKLKWMLDRDRGLRRRAGRGELCFGTIDSWLIFRLTAGQVHVTDYTNASRTMLFNLHLREWDPAMLDLFGVPPEMLPAAVSSRGPIAETAAGTIGARPIPIGAVIGDQQSALFGQGAVEPGQAKVTYGTGAFLLMHTGAGVVRSRNRLLSTTALGPAGEPAYALEGAIFVAGAVVQWLRDGLGLIRHAQETMELAMRGASSSGTFLVPAFVGLGAPYWDADARGAIVGITRGTSTADIVRAALESIAYQVCDVCRAMELDSRGPIAEVRADGGAAANDYLMQFQADVLSRQVRRAATLEVTALGAAMLAGLACGIWRSPAQLARLRGSGRVFRPQMAEDQRKQLLSGWHDAVNRVRTNGTSRRRRR